VRAIVFSCLLAVVLAGCGQSDSDAALGAAEGYVRALGKADGRGTCAHMTHGLQQRFASGAMFANPGLSGDCPTLMQAELDALPPDSRRRFGAATIANLKLKGPTGTFTYTLTGTRIVGKVAKEGGAWKVSCCVPGQDG
jgi:hypothetical protein